MDTVCEGGAECACSERTDAHVEHDEQRNVHAHARSRSPESPDAFLVRLRLTMNLEAGVPLFARRVGSVEQKQASKQSSHRSC